MVRIDPEQQTSISTIQTMLAMSTYIEVNVSRLQDVSQGEIVVSIDCSWVFAIRPKL